MSKKRLIITEYGRGYKIRWLHEMTCSCVQNGAYRISVLANKLNLNSQHCSSLPSET